MTDQRKFDRMSYRRDTLNSKENRIGKRGDLRKQWGREGVREGSREGVFYWDSFTETDYSQRMKKKQKIKTDYLC